MQFVSINPEACRLQLLEDLPVTHYVLVRHALIRMQEASCLPCPLRPCGWLPGRFVLLMPLPLFGWAFARRCYSVPVLPVPHMILATIGMHR